MMNTALHEKIGSLLYWVDEIYCFSSAKFGQMSEFPKLQIICNNLKLGEMHDN